MIVFIPHFTDVGGAGKYINYFISQVTIANEGKVVPLGKYKRYFKREGDDVCFSVSVFFYFMSLLIYPDYRGVGKLLKLFYFCRFVLVLLSIVITLPVFRFLFNREASCGFEHVILTSSIQLYAGLFIKLVLPYSKVTILIQENLVLECFISKSLKPKLLNLMDYVVSITDSWALYARESSINSEIIHIIKNKYVIHSKVNVTSAHIKSYDFIYMGGGQRIKGFDYLCKELYHMRELNITGCFLGEFSPSDIQEIKSSLGPNTNLSIDVIGQVDDAENYINNAKFVLLPILQPHFCRPAIEAGLLGKTFLVSKLPGISDFAKIGYNCLSFDLKERKLAELIMDMLSNESVLSRLSKNNAVFSDNLNKMTESESAFFLSYGFNKG